MMQSVFLLRVQKEDLTKNFEHSSFQTAIALENVDVLDVFMDARWHMGVNVNPMLMFLAAQVPS